MNDMMTVIWKERRGLLRVQGRRSQTLLALLSPILLAIYMPWQIGTDWATGAFSVVVAAIVPFILVGITIPDSFAGERERHTLSTLLASRLPDRAILFGKIVTSVASGWLLTVFVLLLSAVTLNATHWEGEVLFFRPALFAGDLAVGLLVALLTAGIGVQFSLRSPTVRQAQQTTMSVLLVPALLAQFGFLFVMQSDAAKAVLRNTLATVTLDTIVLALVALLVVLDALLLWAAVARFKRDRLILT